MKRSSAVAFVPNPNSTITTELLFRINLFRRSRQFPDLKVSAILCGTAQEWASRIAASRSLFHGDAQERMSDAGIKGVATGECIAMGHDADEVMTLWSDDAPHRAILLGGYGRAGVGMVTGDDGWGYWCLDVAAGED